MQAEHRGTSRLGAALLAAAVVLSGCSVFGSDSGPEQVANDFLGALAGGDTRRAAGLTDSSGPAKDVLDQARSALDPKSIGTQVTQVDESADSAKATYRLDWRLGDGRRWGYEAKATLREVDGTWKVHWQPSVVHPELGAQQTLAMDVETPSPAPVLDRDGTPLLHADTAVSVLVDGKKAGEALPDVATKLAAALRPIDDSITRQSIIDGARESSGRQDYAVATLRSRTYQDVKPAIYELPGVRFTSEERLLPVRDEFGGQLLPAIRGTIGDQVAGRAGWRVVTQDASGAEVAELQHEDPRPAEAVTSTLSTRTQEAAERALRGTGTAGALVAIQPSTGELLAIAQNEKADAEGMSALSGQYPPGSTFKIVTAAAGISSHAVDTGTELECPSSTEVGTRTIPNDHDFDLGTVPLHRAFAESCNTTFATLASELPPDALTVTGRDLGLGADYVIPGLTTITGSAPPAKRFEQRAENAIGQGTVLASPFGMALVAATVANGTTPVPSLLRGVETQTTRGGGDLAPGVIDGLRGMMREVVTDGTGRELADLPGVHGKTGTAQFGDGTHAHGWFAGYQGDVAFAVLLTDAGSSAPAVATTHRFLSGLR